MILRSLLIGIISLASLAQAAEPRNEYPATLDWAGRVSLALTVPGTVETVLVQPGQQVKKGELLAALNPSLYKAGMAEAKAEVDRLGPEETDAKRDLDRVKELYTRTVSSTTELDAAQLRYARAVANLAMAQARLEKARRQWEESELRAPFDAVILTRMAEPGLAAASACQPTPLFSVARSGQLIARTLLDPAQAAPLRPGTKAQVRVGAADYPGTVWGIAAQPDHRYALEVVFSPKAGVLAGQRATINLAP